MGQISSCCKTTNHDERLKNADSPIDREMGQISSCRKTTNPDEGLKLPHNYEAIIKNADSPIDSSSNQKLYDQLYHGVFLKNNKKYWVDKETGHNCFMLFPRALSITWGENKSYWRWLKQKESNEDVEVAELVDVCWFDVKGKFDLSFLSPGTTYEVVYVVMMKNDAYGWELPVNIELIRGDGTKHEHKINLNTKPKEQWVDIQVGEFQTNKDMVGEIQFTLYEHGGHWKRGVMVKGVVIKPKKLGCPKLIKFLLHCCSSSPTSYKI